MANPFDDPETIELPDWYQNSCVVILGDTGLGKSTIVNLCTGNNAACGSTAEAVTRKNTVYDDILHGAKFPKWMDTIGLNDASNENSSFLIFQKFLQALKEQNITAVYAIIWAITPSMRETKDFDDQASKIEAIFRNININDDVNSESKTDIWKNVILLCEKSFKDKQSFQGAKAAIKAKTASECVDNIPCIQMADFRDDGDQVNLKSTEAIRTRDKITESLRNISSPISLNFKNMVCLDCGQINDPRLMALYCHWKPEKKWKEPPKMGGCCPYRGKYFTYLRQKDTLVCANKDCLNDKQKRSKWAKKKWNGSWICTEGNFEKCAVVRRIGKLEVTTSVRIDNASEIRFKEQHNLAEL